MKIISYVFFVAVVVLIKSILTYFYIFIISILSRNRI